MRRLVHVPMLHSRGVLTNMANERRLSGDSRYGSFPGDIASFSDTAFPTARFWETVQQSLRDLDLQKKRLRIYIEGYTGKTLHLPPGEAHRLFPVRDTPEANAIGELINTRGAIIQTTESGRLFRKGQAIYRRFSDIQQKLGLTQDDFREETVGAAANEILRAFATPFRELSINMSKRDKFIARQIGKTLRPDEVGILFLGGSHSAHLQLPADIRVDPLHYELQELLKESRIDQTVSAGNRERR